jgi:transposase
MLKISYENWDQSPESLRSLALNSDHPRTRERFLALFEIATGKKNATQISKETNRNHQTVMGWVHKYNKYGHESLIYKRTGGSLPLFSPKSPKI